MKSALGCEVFPIDDPDTSMHVCLSYQPGLLRGNLQGRAAEFRLEAAANKAPGNVFLHSHDVPAPRAENTSPCAGLVIYRACDAAALHIPNNTHEPHLLTSTFVNHFRLPATTLVERATFISAAEVPTPMTAVGAMLGSLPTQKEHMQGWKNKDLVSDPK